MCMFRWQTESHPLLQECFWLGYSVTASGVVWSIIMAVAPFDPRLASSPKGRARVACRSSAGSTEARAEANSLARMPTGRELGSLHPARFAQMFLIQPTQTCSHDAGPA